MARSRKPTKAAADAAERAADLDAARRLADWARVTVELLSNPDVPTTDKGRKDRVVAMRGAWLGILSPRPVTSTDVHMFVTEQIRRLAPLLAPPPSKTPSKKKIGVWPSDSAETRAEEPRRIALVASRMRERLAAFSPEHAARLVDEHVVEAVRAASNEGGRGRKRITAPAALAAIFRDLRVSAGDAGRAVRRRQRRLRDR